VTGGSQWNGNRGPDRNGYANGNRGPDRNGYADGDRGPGRNGYANGNRGPDRNGYANGNRGGSNGYANGQRWNRDWRGDNRYDWGRYRSGNRDTYRLGRYSAPYGGWSYRRFGVGALLQPLFYGNNFWIDDPYNYRLPQAYGPYRWVRYYNDALLVNIYNGEVVDTVYDIFW
jgi:hypothetical protein